MYDTPKSNKQHHLATIKHTEAMVFDGAACHS
jgi:hypothetical protein